MKKVTIKEIYLKVSEVERLQEIFAKELKKCHNSQIYIEEALFDEMNRNGSQHHIYSHKYCKDSHYEEGCEYKFGFHVDHPFSDTIAKAFFVSNCDGYMQLTKFEKGKINYKHYCVGMKQIIIVYAEAE